MAVYARLASDDRDQRRHTIRGQRLEPRDFDAIEKRDAATVYSLASVFPFLVLGSVFIVTSQVYVRMRIQRRWRSWLTKVMVGRWIANGRYYQLNLIDGDHKNPEARLSEDMRIATEAPVDFVSGVIAAFVSASTFTSFYGPLVER